MAPETILTAPGNLRLYSKDSGILKIGASEKPTTPNDWFAARYPEHAQNLGSPFLELESPLDQFTVQILPISINVDFFAGILGGRKDLGHHVVYFEPEMQWYFREVDGIYRPTTQDKLQNLYRALLMKCATDMPAHVHKLNLFHEFRSDKIAKAVVNRAKSVLAADHTFFSPASPHQRIRGPELIERVARLFVEDLLMREPGQILKLHEAYSIFRALLKQRDMPDIKRSEFKAVVGPLIKEEFDVALRNDLPGIEGGIRGWKGIKLLQTVPS